MKSYLWSALLLASFAFAGDKGNGGYSIVCRDPQGTITSAELLDIYEGRILYKKQYTSEKSSQAIISSAFTRLQEFHSFSTKLRKEISLVEKNLVFIPEGNELEATDDAFPPIKKTGCKFEQLANYTDGGEVLVSQEIYDHLDDSNKAGLVLHEAIYSMRRKALGETTSQNTRRLVAQLASSNPDVNVIEKWVRDTLRPNNKRSCGETGTLEERIESCSYVQEQQASLVLVTRTNNEKEVWYDVFSKLIWSDRLLEKMSFDSASTACTLSRPEMAGLSQYKWRLPSQEEFSGYGESIIHILPNMNANVFWTTTLRGRLVSTYSGSDGQFGYHLAKSGTKNSVRCVSKL
jgi:hypothetical protein